MKVKIPFYVKEKMQKLINAKFDVYVVGGAVRDSLMGKEPHDWDLFTNATGEDILNIFPNGKVIGNEERQEKILTVVVDDIEISQFRKSGDRKVVGDSLKHHLSTCDFTVNSIACDIEGNIIDPNNGEWDIRQKVLRFVGNPIDRMNEDPLRILRGQRFWATFGTWEDRVVVLDNLDLLDKLPRERIRDEFITILSSKNGLENLTYNKEMILKIIPEYEKVIGMHGGDNHAENVDKHMLNAFKIAHDITKDWRIKLAAFFHDLGKGVCVSNNSETGIHFYQHEKVGAEIVENWMRKYKFSNNDIEFVSTLVRYHMWSYKAGEISKKSYLRMFNNFKSAGISIYDFVMVIYCDHQANNKKPKIKFGDFCKDSWILQRYWECVHTKEPFNKNDLELQGGDIIKIFNKEPGKWVGELMDKMLEAIMNDELINDRLELVKWVKKQ